MLNEFKAETTCRNTCLVWGASLQLNIKGCLVVVGTTSIYRSSRGNVADPSTFRAQNFHKYFFSPIAGPFPTIHYLGCKHNYQKSSVPADTILKKMGNWRSKGNELFLDWPSCPYTVSSLPPVTYPEWWVCQMQTIKSWEMSQISWESSSRERSELGKSNTIVKIQSKPATQENKPEKILYQAKELGGKKNQLPSQRVEMPQLRSIKEMLNSKSNKPRTITRIWYTMSLWIIYSGTYTHTHTLASSAAGTDINISWNNLM